MGDIVILDENTSNKIAAGEVIERPASVVKEFVENSIDAGASSITIEIKKGGISFIKVVDNGSGIKEDDVEIAFERHATSKIRNADDIETIGTLGFRGEALASIAAVSKVELTTRVESSPYGKHVKIQGGQLIESRQTGCPVGTTFVVRDLFYNTPARFKFLKKDSSEARYIIDVVSRIALAKPDISFRLINNGETVLHTPGNNDLLSAIFSIYGKEIANNVVKVDYKSEEGIKISGYVGRPEIARASRSYQSFYINGRYIKSKLITSAIDEAYKTIVLKNKFPFIILNININPMFVDVNVHPTKMEVRFSDEQAVFKSIYHAINNALMSTQLIKTVKLDNEKNGSDRSAVFKIEKDDEFYTQFDSTRQQKLDFETGRSSKSYQTPINKNHKLISDIQNNFLKKEYNNKTSDGTVPTERENDDRINSIDRINAGFDEAGRTLYQNKEANDTSKGNSGTEITDAKGQYFAGIDSSNKQHDYLKLKSLNEEKAATEEKPGKIAPEDEIRVIDHTDIKELEKADSNGNINLNKAESKDANINAAVNTNINSNADNEAEIQEKNDNTADANSNYVNEKHENKIGLFENVRIIGQAFSTYVLLEHSDEIIMIDQHAAHERIIYEKLKSKYRANEALAQMLLVPVVVELTNQEVNFLEEEKEFFSKLGFIYEDFGNNSVILRSVPGLKEKQSAKEAFLQIIDSMMDTKETDYEKAADDILYTIACKAAIKANLKLENMEIESLLNELKNMENPFTCPHGRPVMVRITKHEVEKMFKRIV